MHYWLLKTEPDSYSIDDLSSDTATSWDGVRNYQARNFLRSMSPGDMAVIYHSSTKEPHAAGVGMIASAPYPDPTQFDSVSGYFDPKSTIENPRWSSVQVAFSRRFTSPVLLSTLRNDSRFRDMKILERGSRLSITPLSKSEYDGIVVFGG